MVIAACSVLLCSWHSISCLNWERTSKNVFIFPPCSCFLSLWTRQLKWEEHLLNPWIVSSDTTIHGFGELRISNHLQSLNWDIMPGHNPGIVSSDTVPILGLNHPWLTNLWIVMLSEPSLNVSWCCIIECFQKIPEQAALPMHEREMRLAEKLWVWQVYHAPCNRFSVQCFTNTCMIPGGSSQWWVSAIFSSDFCRLNLQSDPMHDYWKENPTESEGVSPQKCA